MKFRGMIRVVLCLSAGLVTTPALRADFLAPGDTVAGVSQSQMAGRWGQWALSYPASGNPLLDATGTLSALGNQGDVFFLAGYAGPPNQGVVGLADRTVTVSAYQPLYLPILNSFAATADGIPLSALPGAVAGLVGTPDQMSATLTSATTGKSQTLGLSDLLAHRQSATFDTTLPPNNLDGVPAGPTTFVTDGYWLAIAPLAPGTYTLNFTGHSVGHLPNGYGFDGSAFDNTQTITYTITSQSPEPATWLLALAGGVPLLARLRSRWRLRAAAGT